ncbi:hypothetical protein KVT40_008717 [Elsinoe batatas]|uniref:Metallo-beta-lactamase domain-containing protein n=1 Tax=Elsinoe batatas TaxID=2601811 RepID=A0A8K0KTP5_9PEZI|nr:hypothetical protein KVT40_008717 [Elsinoe batatas]
MATEEEIPDLDLIICVACGTQYDVTYEQGLERCKICDDPRQFIPPSGQQWTSLRQSLPHHSNQWTPDPFDARIYHITTTPKLGIGQRASLLLTPHGAIIWDLTPLLTPALLSFLRSHGPILALIISHPHFYTTHLVWATLLDCPVYLSAEDQAWLSRPDPTGRRRFLTQDKTEIIPGVTAIKTGGHFEGSLVLHWDGHLFVADSIMTTPAAGTPRPRPDGMGAYSFMWSIPNMVPLGPEEVGRVWRAVKGVEFEATHGLMMGMDVRDAEVKRWVLRDAKRQVRRMGAEGHWLLEEREEDI